MEISQIQQETIDSFELDRKQPLCVLPTISGFRDGDEALDTKTRQLIKCVLGEYAGLLKPMWSESKALSTMKRVVDDLVVKHRYTYNGIINKLQSDDRGDNVRFISEVADSLFSDGTTNWGRIVSLIAFGAVVCDYLKEKGRENCVELVGEEICVCLLTDRKDWLIKNNSWEGFVEFFQVANMEYTLGNIFLIIAGVAGIGAALTLLIK